MTTTQILFAASVLVVVVLLYAVIHVRGVDESLPAMTAVEDEEDGR